MYLPTRPSLTRRLARALAFAALVGCSDATGPDGAVPHELSLANSANLRAVAGEYVPELLATVTDANGRPVSRALVRLSVDGGGTIAPDSAHTDARGHLRIVWRLGMAARQQTLTLRAAPLEPVTVTATAEGKVSSVLVTMPGDSMLVGDTLAFTARVVDNFGDERPELPVLWTTASPGLLTVDTGGRVAALGEGEVDVFATVRGVRGTRRVRARDVPSALLIVPVVGSPRLDVEDSLRLTTHVVGRTGRPLTRTVAVTWSCSGAGVVARCDSVVRPRLMPLAQPETVYVAATGEGLSGSLPVAVWEAPMQRMTVSWLPSSFVAVDTLRPDGGAEVTLGDTTRLLVEVIGDAVGGFYPYRFNRPFRLSSSDSSIATVSLGGVVEGRRVVNVVGRRVGNAVVRILVNGAGAALTARVAPRAANACASDRTMELDLALGGAVTVREGDAVQPRCLRFDRARDQGRVYLVMTDALPRRSGRYPNLAGDRFGVEGQGLFYDFRAPVPFESPTARLYAPGWQPPTALRAAESPSAPAPTWIVDGKPLFEAPMDTTRRRPRSDGASIMAATGPTIAVGDTIDVGWFAYFDETLKTTDGGPVDTRVVVRHVGARLVIAEMLDALRSRLRYSDGSAVTAIPADRYAALETAYEIPARQLARLFPGTPALRQVFGRDFGTREMVVNVPLAGGYGGYASGEWVVMDYWSNGDDPRAIDIADGVLAHEFAHMRHIAHFWPNGATPPWLVEGLANFAERLASTARALGSDAPSRTGRAQAIGDINKLPGMNVNRTYSFFTGYHAASYPLDYLADHVEAAGGNGLAAVLALAQHGGEARTADSVIAAVLPGFDVQSLYLRARVALVLEWQRSSRCTTCIAPDPALPAWTRFLQYDIPALMPYAASDSEFWPVLRPGTSGGLTMTQRTGTFWPALIDGRGEVGDATWILDMSTAPETTVSIVRIR